MKGQREWIDDGLKDLKKTMEQYYAADVDHKALQSRIKAAIEEEPSTGRKLKGPRWRRFGPLGAAVAAVCIIALVAGVQTRGGVLGGMFGGGQTTLLFNKGSQAAQSKQVSAQVTTQWSEGFQAISSTQASQFRHVKGISLYLGNNVAYLNSSVDSKNMELTADEQAELYAIMKSSQVKTVSDPTQNAQNIYLPFQINIDVNLGKSEMSFSGSYSPAGFMVLGNQWYAPNTALASFINKYMLSPLLVQYRGAGKVFSNSATTAALGFVHNLKNPTEAYRYCVPDAAFHNLTLQQLQKEASARQFSDYQITSITYGPGHAEASVVLRHPNRFWASPLCLNLVHMGNAWFVLQVGAQFDGDSYFGWPLQSSFGLYHTLVIGPKVGTIKPSGNTPGGASSRVTVISRDNLTSPAYQTAQIIIYERRQLPRDATEQDFVQEMQSDPAFQKAIQQAKSRHAVVVLAGGSDHLLTSQSVVDALGVQSSTGYDTSPSTYLAIWFTGPKMVLMRGEAYVYQSNGKKYADPLAPMVIDRAIDSAALLRDTWGGVQY